MQARTMALVFCLHAGAACALRAGEPALVMKRAFPAIQSILGPSQKVRLASRVTGAAGGLAVHYESGQAWITTYTPPPELLAAARQRERNLKPSESIFPFHGLFAIDGGGAKLEVYYPSGYKSVVTFERKIDEGDVGNRKLHASLRQVNEAIYAAMKAEGLAASLPKQDPGGENPCAVSVDSGRLEIRFKGSQDWMDVPRNSPVRIGDTLRIKGAGRARLVFPDGVTFLVKSDTELTLQNDRVDLVTGGGVFQVDKRGSTFQVVTPNAAIGVLGTTFSVTLGEAGRTTLLRVAEGAVSFRSTRTGQVLTVRAGESARSTAEGLGPTTRFAVPAQLQGWDLEAPRQEAAAEALGQVWQEREGDWTGTWTRRPGSAVFDAVWTLGTSRVTAVLTMHLQGSQVRVERRQSSDGDNFDYQGRVSADGRRVEGTYVVGGITRTWSATISPRDPLGRIWSEQEGSWQGTWTRRSTSRVFDAVWTLGSSRVTAVLTVNIQGQDVRIERRQSSDGDNFDYLGRLSPDGRKVEGTYTVKGVQRTWSAVIQP